MDDSLIDLTRKDVIPPHLTRSPVSKSTSTPIIASGSPRKLDTTSVRHGRSPRNTSKYLPKSRGIFLSDSESENDEDLSIIHVKAQRVCSPVPTVHEANDSQGEQ
jgi:hypothetical protein